MKYPNTFLDRQLLEHNFATSFYFDANTTQSNVNDEAGFKLHVANLTWNFPQRFRNAVSVGQMR